MSETEINQIIARNRVLESDNRLLNEKLKNKNKELRKIKKLYQDLLDEKVKLKSNENQIEFKF